MIISKAHQFIFAAIPKTGTHSVRQALRAHLGPEDLEQVGLFVEQAFPLPRVAADPPWPFQLPTDPALPRPRTSSPPLFKFAFVRNPFDRFISYLLLHDPPGGLFRP